MFISSHISRRGRTALYTPRVPSSTPKEPLLFLYPQWFRNVVTACSKVSQAASPSPSPGPNNETQTLEHRLPGSVKDGFCLSSTGGPWMAGVIREEQRSNPHPRRGSFGKVYPSGEVFYPREASVHCKPPSNEGGTVSARKAPSHTAHAIVRRVLGNEEKRTARRMRNQRAREDYEESKLLERQMPLPDWRTILTDLELHTPNGSTTWRDSALRIVVPFKAAGKFLFSEDDNIWSIKMRCGCEIEVSEADEGRDRRALLISGPATSIVKAATEILRIAADADLDKEIWNILAHRFNTKAPDRLPDLPVDESTLGIIRFVRAERRRRMTAPIRAYKIFQPDSWTPTSFGMYVQRLTSMSMSTHLQRVLYGPKNHLDVVLNILEALFVDPKCKAAITTAAFNNALAYFVRNSQMRIVQDLYVRMEMQQLKMNTETYNIMLRGTAKSKSLHNFRFIFGLMLRRGHSPNADTCLAYMRTVGDFQIKLRVLDLMRRKELLHDPQIQKAVCENLAKEEIDACVDNEFTQEQFLQHMGDRYGRDWLSKSSANIVLDTLGSRGLISRCWEFLEFMHTRDVKPSNVSIQTILDHCKKQGNADGAVEIIRRASSLTGFTADQFTYDTLFSIAWKSRLYSVARVVWRYACLDAATTLRMRVRVSKSAQTALLDPHPASFGTVRGRWRATAGPFILGKMPSRRNGLEIKSMYQEEEEMFLQQSTPLKLNGGDPECLGLPNSPFFSKDGTKEHKQGDILDDNSVATLVSHPHGRDGVSLTGEGKEKDPEEAAFKDDMDFAIMTRGKGNSVKLIVTETVGKQMKIFKDWVPKIHFANMLTEALAIDKEWTSSGARYREEEAMIWLVANAKPIPLRRRGRLEGLRNDALWT